MKKIAPFVFLIFVVTHFGYSQNQFGIKIGGNVSKIAKSNLATDPNTYSRIGYQVGLYKEYGLSQKLVLRPELFYSLKGFKYHDVSTGNKIIVSYNYLTLPLLIGYRPIATVAVFAGPEFSTLGPVRVITNGNREDDRVVNLRNLTNEYENFDVGLTAGFLYKVTSRISADIRYTYGFSTILEWDVTNMQGQKLYTRRESNNKTLQFNLNYAFRKKG